MTLSGNLRIGSWHLDGWLLALTVLLLGLGLTMLTSASITVADRELGQPFYYLFSQLTALGLGVAALLVVLHIPMNFWEKTSFLWVGLALLLLVLVFIPHLGYTANGATRWIRIAGVGLQTSDPARLLMVMYLAGYMVRHQEALTRSLTGLLKPMLFVGLACALLIQQPDYGAVVVLVAISASMLFIGGAQLRYFILFAALLGVLLVWLALGAEYRLDRMTGFRDPFSDPNDTTYQLLQSLIAFGRGEWFGVGLGNSVQKLFYLPEAHTDFVFAVLAEELGLFGVLATVALFALLVWRCFQLSLAASRQQQFYAAYIAFGIGLWLGLQAFINMGVSMGLLPTKGLPLPLMSYGRSGLLVTLTAVGLLLRIHHEIQIADVRATRATRHIDRPAAKPRRAREAAA